MKSKLFSKRLLLDSKEFVSDLKKALELEGRFFDDFPEIVVNIHLSHTSQEADEIFFNAAELLNVDESRLRSSFQIVGTFIKELAPDGDANQDSIESIVSDLTESSVIASPDTDKLSRLLSASKKVAVEQFYKAQRKKRYETSGLPTLVGIIGTVNLRAVFKEEYKSNIAIDKYSPKCEGLVPVATVKLRLDSDSPFENVFFQITSREIKIIISHLQSLEKQIISAVKFTKLEEI